MIEKKYFRPKEIEQVFGIKTSTLSKQRQGKFGLPIPLWVETQNQIEAE